MFYFRRTTLTYSLFINLFFYSSTSFTSTISWWTTSNSKSKIIYFIFYLSFLYHHLKFWHRHFIKKRNTINKNKNIHNRKNWTSNMIGIRHKPNLKARWVVEHFFLVFKQTKHLLIPSISYQHETRIHNRIKHIILYFEKYFCFLCFSTFYFFHILFNFVPICKENTNHQWIYYRKQHLFFCFHQIGISICICIFTKLSSTFSTSILQYLIISQFFFQYHFNIYLAYNTFKGTYMVPMALMWLWKKNNP